MDMLRLRLHCHSADVPLTFHGRDGRILRLMVRSYKLSVVRMGCICRDKTESMSAQEADLQLLTSALEVAFQSLAYSKSQSFHSL